MERSSLRWWNGTELLDRQWNLQDQIEYDSDPNEAGGGEKKSHIHKATIISIKKDQETVVLRDDTNKCCNYSLNKIAIKLPNKLFTFDSVPNDIIGKIGSFLPLQHYLKFESINKRIKNVLRSPYTLNKLRLIKSDMLRYSLKFTKITKLFIDISIMSMLWPMETITTNFHQIKELTLKGDENTTNDEVVRILFSGLIDFMSVITLNIVNLSIDWEHFSQYLYLFPNVENLSLRNFTTNDDRNRNDDDDFNFFGSDDENDDEEKAFDGLQCVLPKLTTLKITGRCTALFCKKLIDIFGNNLCMLSFDDKLNISSIAKVIDDKKLIYLGLPTTSFYDLMIQKGNALHLKQVYINGGVIKSTQKELQQLMFHLISKQKFLFEIMCVVNNDIGLRNICDAITHQLIESRDDKRDKPLTMKFYVKKPCGMDEIKRNILKITTVFNYYYLDADWMLDVVFMPHHNHNNFGSFLSSSYSDKYCVYQQKINSSQRKIVISNKQCKIDRY